MTEARSGIICAGNWILDIVHDIPRWPDKSDLVEISAQRQAMGGGAANVSCDLISMGAPYPVIPMGLIGQDGAGDKLLGLCAEAGVPVAHIRRTDRAATAQTHVMNVRGDSRTFFYHGGAGDLFDLADMDLHCAPARLFYLGYVGLLARLDAVDVRGDSHAAQVLAQARGLGMLTCVDLVSSVSESFRARVEAVLPHVDVLLLNEVEAARATGLPIADADDLAWMQAATEALLARGVQQAVVLHSARHVVWAGADAVDMFETPQIPPEQIVSAVGAGDAFAAGILHGLHEGWPRAQAVTLAFDAARACLAGETATDGVARLGPVLAR
jgi:sugar/nucleoside kinase (ribokinase family)